MKKVDHTPGRPASGAPRVHVATYLAPGTAQALQAQATASGRSLSGMISDVLEAWLAGQSQEDN